MNKIPEPPKLPTPPPTLRIRDHRYERERPENVQPAAAFLYGMWFMWFALCVYAQDSLTTYPFAIGAIIIPGLLVMVGRGVWFLVRLVKFKWERR